jgi:quinol monooxygenase YgiN
MAAKAAFSSPAENTWPTQPTNGAKRLRCGSKRALRQTSILRGVMTVRNSSRPIARVFRATAAPGCRDELLQRFHSSSATLVNSKAGCLKYRNLEPVDASAPEVVFESIWRDLDAVKVAFGDAWQHSHLPEGYSALMTTYSVHHFLVSESSTTK